MIANPGQVFDWQDYQPRFPYVGAQTDLKTVSYPSNDSIPVGSLVQLDPTKPGCVRRAIDTSSIVGVAIYDPGKYDASLVWQPYDVIPIVRRGRVYVRFTGTQSPLVLGGVRFYSGGDFTTDMRATILLPDNWVFQVASMPYYDNGDTGVQGASDLVLPPLPNPVGVTATTFGGCCALVEIS